LGGIQTFIRRNSSGCACDLHHSIEEVATQGRIWNGGLVQAFSSRLWKMLMGDNKCIILVVAWAWGAS
jgi:hypothetical protein